MDMSEEVKNELKKYENSEFENEYVKCFRMIEELKKLGIYRIKGPDLMPIEKRHSYKLPVNQI